MIRFPRNPLLITTALLSWFAAHSVEAFCIYNETGRAIRARVYQGDFDVTIAPRAYTCCHYSDAGCNPSGSQTSQLTLEISTRDGDGSDYLCVVALQGGGYALLYEENRSALGLPPNLYCQSFTHDHQLLDYSNYGVGASSRDVRFLVSADCQYSNSEDHHAGDNGVAAQVNARMLDLLRGNRRIRGILYAGDLTSNTRRVDEFQWFKDDFSGFTRFLFHGLGNHDVYEPNSTQEAACFFNAPACVDPGALRSHVRDTRRQTSKTTKGDPHYSWDWHDVHFVQLNLFPGGELPSTLPDPSPIWPYVYADHDPLGALDFLRSDLAANVGNSQRPVILVHHYGFDNFSIGRNHSAGSGKTNEIWWTEAQRLAYWNAIQNYNVVGIFTGHAHLKETDTQWRIPWNRPPGATGGPASIPSFISGAALYGVFLDVELNSADQLIVRRLNRHGSELDRASVCLSRGVWYVSLDNPRSGNGTAQNPFRTFGQAVSALASSDPACANDPEIRMDGGWYRERAFINRRVRLKAIEGPVLIGTPN
jgi:hypothetical protein